MSAAKDCTRNMSLLSTPEQYNRIVRLLQHGITPELSFDIAVDYQKDHNALNVIDEIPGTTKPDEVVMLGGHFDSWHGGTGATDNGTGASVAMETRIRLRCASPWLAQSV